MAGFSYVRDLEHKYQQLADAHLKKQFQRLNDFMQAYEALNNYNYEDRGRMPNFSWTVPNTQNVFLFEIDTGQILFNGNAFSNLGSNDKVYAHKYLDEFMKECFRNYDFTVLG